MTAIKSLYMKPTIYNLLFAVIVAGMLAACSAATKEDDKEGRLEKLKSEQANLAKEIQKLQTELEKENPEAASSVRAKEIAVTEITPQKFEHYVQTQGN